MNRVNNICCFLGEADDQSEAVDWIINQRKGASLCSWSGVFVIFMWRYLSITKSKLGVKSEAEHLIHIFLACHKVWHQSCLFFIFSHYPCISQSNVTFVLMQTRVHRFIFAWILLPDVKTSHATRQSLMGRKLKWIWINIV